MSRRPPAPLALLLGLALAAAAPAQAVNTDEQQLKAAGIEPDGEKLLTFFKKRTLADDTRERAARLIAQLGADTFADREQASNDLEDLGGLVRAQLAQASRHPDPEVRRRARRVLRQMGPASAENSLLPLAARVLAAKRPAGAAEAILNFLPCVEDADVAEEVARALPPLALGKDGKPAPAIAAALEDRFAVKRAAAAEALIAAGEAHRPAARRLLKDAEPGVRRRVAIALLNAREKEAVPVLLELLKSKSAEDAEAAEDALSALAGEAAIAPPEGDRPADRDRYVRLWEEWWRARGDKIDLAKADLTGAGRHTLVTVIDNGARLGKGGFGGRGLNNGAVMELDNAGKVRWEITDLRYPVHVSKHRRDRLLICEYYGNKVTERDLTGRILWERVVPGQVVSAERLPSGNTFIVARNRLFEVDPKGAEVRAIDRSGYDCLSAKRLKDGKILMVSSGGFCAKLDASGREISRFAVGAVTAPMGFNAHFLPRGGVIVPDYSNSKVREYDASGKMVWEATVTYPGSAVRLGNGNTLVAPRTGTQLVELDRTGKEVARRDVKGSPIFVDRR